MLLYIIMGMGWEWEYGHKNGREWDQKSYSRTSLNGSDQKVKLMAVFMVIVIALSAVVKLLVKVLVIALSTMV